MVNARRYLMGFVTSVMLRKLDPACVTDQLVFFTVYRDSAHRPAVKTRNGLVTSLGVTATRIRGYPCSIPTWCAAVTSPSGLFRPWEKEHDQRSIVRDRARSTST